MARPGIDVDRYRSFIDLAGGLNTDASTYTMEDTEASDLLNVRLDPLGPIGGRLGTDLQNLATGYGTPTGAPPEFTGAAIQKPMRSLYRYYKTDGNDLLLFTLNQYLGKIADLGVPGTAENIPPDGGAVTDPAFVDDADETAIDQAWEFLTIKDWAYFCTTTGLLRRTDGVDVYLVGETCAEDPASASEINVGVGSLPNGTYEYVLTRVYKDGLGESPVSGTWTGAVAAGPSDLRSALPALPRSDVVGYNVYRGKVDVVGGPKYRVNISPATAGDFDDSVVYGSLGDRAKTNLIEPPKSKFLTLHQNRVALGYLTEGTIGSPEESFFSVAFSNSNAPDEFEFDIRYTVHVPNGETPTGMASYNNILYVTTLSYITPIVGTGILRGPTLNLPDYRIAASVRGPGCLSHRALKQANGELYMTNHIGVWRMRGNRIQDISENRVAKNVIRAEMDPLKRHLAIGVATEHDYRVTFPKRAGSTLPELTLIWDFKAEGFLVDEGYELADYAFLDGGADDLELYATEASDLSLLYKGDTDNQDWDAAGAAKKNIERRWRSKDFSLGGKVGATSRNRTMVIDGRNTQSTVTLKIHMNRDRLSQTVQALDFYGAASKWGAAIWGQFKWGVKGQIQKHISMPQAAIGERIAIEFVQNTAEAPFLIEMFAIGGQDKGVRGVTYG